VLPWSPLIQSRLLVRSGARQNAPASFLAQHDFFTPMVFRASAAAELAPRTLVLGAQTASPSRDCQPLGWPRDSLSAQAPLAKIVIRSKMAGVFLVVFLD